MERKIYPPRSSLGVEMTKKSEDRRVQNKEWLMHFFLMFLWV
jgi:hypothetical protein